MAVLVPSRLMIAGRLRQVEFLRARLEMTLTAAAAIVLVRGMIRLHSFDKLLD